MLSVKRECAKRRGIMSDMRTEPRMNFGQTTVQGWADRQEWSSISLIWPFYFKGCIFRRQIYFFKGLSIPSIFKIEKYEWRLVWKQELLCRIYSKITVPIESVTLLLSNFRAKEITQAVNFIIKLTLLYFYFLPRRQPFLFRIILEIYSLKQSAYFYLFSGGRICLCKFLQNFQNFNRSVIEGA